MDTEIYCLNSFRDRPKVDIIIADSGALPVDVIEHAEL